MSDFTTAYLIGLMPSSKKKNAAQVLKKFKNRVIKHCEEAAKNDRTGCSFTLQRLELGLPLQYNLEQIAEDLCAWLIRKGLKADLDPSNLLCINISWATEEPESPPPLSYVPPVEHVPINPQGHPFFNWMGPQKTPISQLK